MEQHFSIEPLTADTLEETCALATLIFDDEVQNADVELRHSVEGTSFLDMFGERMVRLARYWIMQIDNTVVGFIGLYENDDEPDDVTWIGWYGVHPEYRERGIGTVLLEHVINVAKSEEKTMLKVYTSTYAGERQALKLYKAHGFAICDVEVYKPDPLLDVLYLEKKL